MVMYAVIESAIVPSMQKNVNLTNLSINSRSLRL